MGGTRTLKESHILLIHPRPEELRVLLSQMQSAGVRISMATTSRQGLQRAQALPPDLILLNVQMPKMDGLALCRLLRETPAARHIPIIFLSTVSTVEDRLQGFALGAADYVTQPFVPEEVMARICIHLARGVQRTEQRDPPDQQLPQDADEITLRAAMRLIDQQLDAPPPLMEIARLVGTHGKRLTTIFRRYLGVTVYAYIREQRLRKSQELLASSNATIQDIADLIGFRSAANFATSFRERTGMTPSAFRKQIREMKQWGALDGLDP